MKTLYIKTDKNIIDNIKNFFNLKTSNLFEAEEKIPSLDFNEVLIKTLVCGICPTEIQKIIDPRIVKNLSFKLGRKSGSFYPGHEIVGVIKDVGSQIDKSLINKIVTIADINICKAFNIDPECSSCKKSRGILCQSKSKVIRNKNKKVFGGFSEYFIRSQGQFLILDEGINKLNAAFIEPLSTAINCESKLLINTEDRILINGLSTISILFYRYLKFKNYNLQNVFFAVENSFQKQEAIQKKINNVIVSSHKENFCIDKFFDFTGKYQNLDEIIKKINKRGEIFLFGMKDEFIKLETAFVINNEIKISGIHGYSSKCIGTGKYITDIEKASIIIKNNSIYVEDLISDVHPLCDAKKVLEKICRLYKKKNKLNKFFYRTLLKS